MDDLEFVQKCLRQDKQAWDEFLIKYSRLIYNYIYSVLNTKGYHLSRDNVSDIFQEILYSLLKDNFRKLRSFKARNGCSLASWLRQVTINATIDYTRRLKPTLSLDEETDDFSLKDILADESLSITDKLSLQEKFNDLKDCIEGLDNEEQYFLELHFHRDLSLEDLKEHFRLSRGAIDMRKKRVIERLRDCFKKKGF